MPQSDDTDAFMKPGNGFYSSAGDILRWGVMFAIVAMVSFLFVDMIWPFVVALALAAIGSALAGPPYSIILKWTQGNKAISAAITLFLALLLVITPLVVVAVLAADQARELVQSAAHTIGRISADPDQIKIPQWLPFHDMITGVWPQIAAKAGSIAGSIAAFLIPSLYALTQGTAVFFLNLFVFVYALFIFLQMDVPVISQLLSFTGMRVDTQILLADRIVSVGKATIKGTVVIGLIQGGLGALGFWFAGISGAAFWGIVMVIASVVPGVGAAAIVIGGSIYLGLQAEMGRAIALALWGGLVVGTIDNLLRPRLVGRDAQMNDVLILVSTLGGLSMFGVVGLILGPIVAGVFISVWTVIAEEFAMGNEPR